MTKYVVGLAVIDMVSAKSDVNGSKEKVLFFQQNSIGKLKLIGFQSSLFSARFFWLADFMIHTYYCLNVLAVILLGSQKYRICDIG